MIQPTTNTISYDPETRQVTGSATWAAGPAGFRVLRLPLFGLDYIAPTAQSVLFVRGTGPGSGWSVTASAAAVIRVKQPFDFNGDGMVDAADQGELLLRWADYDNPGEALGQLLKEWGLVPTVAQSQSISISVIPAAANGGGTTTAQSMTQPALVAGPDSFDDSLLHELIIRIHCTDGVALTVQPVLYL